MSRPARISFKLNSAAMRLLLTVRKTITLLRLASSSAPFAKAIDETFNDPTYSKVVLEF